MHEILSVLTAADRVLDLGSDRGSFAAAATAARVVRADLEPAQSRDAVACDAAGLPFHRDSFRAVISNHSLEHFADLAGALGEIGRVLRDDGYLYIAVPDASTLSDRLYRWLGRGGGHVNPFLSVARLAELVEQSTGRKFVAQRLLVASFSFLNRRNIPGRMQRKMWLLARGAPGFVASLSAALRAWDRLFGTRASVYGWACYFGSDPGGIVTDTWSNVCSTCGSAAPSSGLEPSRLPWGLLSYRCPRCGGRNLFTRDESSTSLR